MHTGSVRIGPAHESRFKSQPYLKSLANSPDALATAAASFRSRLRPGRYGLEKRLNTFAATENRGSADLCFGSGTDIQSTGTDVRFTTQS